MSATSGYRCPLRTRCLSELPFVPNGELGRHSVALEAASTTLNSRVVVARVVVPTTLILTVSTDLILGDMSGHLLN